MLPGSRNALDALGAWPPADTVAWASGTAGVMIGRAAAGAVVPPRGCRPRVRVVGRGGSVERGRGFLSLNMSPARRTSSSRPAPGPSSTAPHPRGERLQKVLAASGVASRRECESLILAGRVEVDGTPVTQLGARVDPSRQQVRVDGVPLGRPRHVYYLVNKPPGVVSTTHDPARRIRVIDLVPGDARLFTIGRLDRSSEGLIVVTNDGEVTNILTHPRYGVAKTYRAMVLGLPAPEALQKLRSGVHLAEGLARVTQVRVRARHPRGAELEMVLTEGRNREIRRILARIGHKVLHLRRVAVGPLRLGNLGVGDARRLTPVELQQLHACLRRARRQAAELPAPAPRGRARPSGPSGLRRPRGTGRPPQGVSDAVGEPTRRPTASKRKFARPRQGTVLDFDHPPRPARPSPARPGRKPRRKGPRG